MNSICYKVFSITITSGWEVDDYGYANPTNFTGDRTAANWEPDSVIFSWDPELGFGDASGYQYGLHAVLTLGPYGVDKDISVDGNIALLRVAGWDLSFQVFGDGQCDFWLTLTNLNGYSGDYHYDVNPPLGPGGADVFSLSGMLPAGLPCVVELISFGVSYPAPSECIGDLTITVNDVP